MLQNAGITVSNSHPITIIGRLIRSARYYVDNSPSLTFTIAAYYMTLTHCQCTPRSQFMRDLVV